MSTPPRVTVGIPTYNRPDGLLRTLQQITAQTHANLEIVVSNNCSTNGLVAAVLNRCAELDPRIRAFHQPENLGIVKNFKFVLRQAASDFFMWAADDDEWDPTFIERCMQGHARSQVGTVMTGFYRHNRALDVKGPAVLPKMTGEDRFADAMNFYRAMPHSMFYGVHRRATLDWYLQEEDGANDDEYLLIQQILTHGILTLPEHLLYTAGINDAQYQIKLPQEAPDRYFYQYKRLLRYGELLAECRHVDDAQKMKLLHTVVLAKLWFVLRFEHGMRDPAQHAMAQQIYDFLNELDVNHLPVYTQLIRNAKQAMVKMQAAQAEAARAAAAAPVQTAA